MDMAGNVWEWTDSWYDKDKDIRVLRGGSWYLYLDYCRTSYRSRNNPEYPNFYVGFCCCQDLK
jgi:formylglycine-generating enzyme required for sulfatase activity